MKERGVLGGSEVAVVGTPVADRFGDPGDESADTALALRSAQLAVKILAGDNVGRGHRPVDRHLDVFLLEDGFAGRVGDRGGAALPLDFVVWRDAGPGKDAVEAEAFGCPGTA